MADAVDEVIDLYKQWMFNANSPRGLIHPKSDFDGPRDRNYSLKNKFPRKFLQWEDQTFGINLGWTDDAEAATEQRVRRWFFTKADDTPLRYGEVIAIGNGGDPSFLQYESRTIGINLAWSNDPKFEWKILGGKIDAPVEIQDWVVLFNLKSEEGEPLLYFDRNSGGDIGWPSSRTWSEQLGERLWDLVKEFGEKAIQALLAKV